MSEERLLEREQENNDALQSAKIAQIRAQVPTGKGPEFCLECGNDMPSVRREYGYVLCVECKTAEER